MKAKPSAKIGQITIQNTGEEHVLAGWVGRVRRQKLRTFVDLRSQQDTLQVVFEKGNCAEEMWDLVQSLHREDVIGVRGRIVAREAANINLDARNGHLEMRADGLEILNSAKEVPLPIDDHTPVDEQVRLRHRYLDLRSPRMQRNLRRRAALIRLIRAYLEERGFIEVETPILANPTPEGARDFLVPSRLQLGTFYALPQSPQQFKQLLMVGGIEQYYQIARCFRDEDSRGDRQPEFTQLDLEMSFVDAEDVIELVSGLLQHVFQALGVPYTGTWPIPRLTYKEAVAQFGSDKPDTRFDLHIVDLGQASGTEAMPLDLKEAMASEGGRVAAIRVPRQPEAGAAALRKWLEVAVVGMSNGDFHAVVLDAGAEADHSLAALAVPSITDGGAQSLMLPSSATALVPEQAAAVATTWKQAVVIRSGLEAGELMVVGWGPDWERVSLKMGEIRLQVAEQLGLRDPGRFDLVWVTDFPLVEWNEDERRWDPVHHPFTSPLDEDLGMLGADPAKVRAKAYDIVMQGVEIGGGSIRIHKRDVQEKLFELIGMDAATAQMRFGHMLEAFEYGTPPHGGIALGLDRVAMLFLGEPSIREVIAFPKTSSGVDVMTNSPSQVLEQQLKDVHIRIR